MMTTDDGDDDETKLIFAIGQSNEMKNNNPSFVFNFIENYFFFQIIYDDRQTTKLNVSFVSMCDLIP